MDHQIQNYSDFGLFSVLTTFSTWSLYGVVAVLGTSSNAQPFLTEMGRNSAYNVLDIVSKNVVCLVVSALALSVETECVD